MDAEKRDSLPDWQFAGPHRSFPISSQEDVENAARLVGHASDPSEVKANIIKIAKKLKLKLPESWEGGETTQDDIYNALSGIHELLQKLLLQNSPPLKEDNSFRNPAPFHVEGSTGKFLIDSLEGFESFKSALVGKSDFIILETDSEFIRIDKDKTVSKYETFEDAYRGTSNG